VKKFIKKFRFRWHDIDANRHVANTSYTTICVDLRVQALQEYGLDQDYFDTHQMGPVVLNEKLHYISEVRPDEQLYVDMELAGRSKSSKFFNFAHHIYGEDGEIVFYMTTIISILDLKNRSLIDPPEPMLKLLDAIPRTEGYEELKKKDLRDASVPYSKTLDLNAID